MYRLRGDHTTLNNLFPTYDAACVAARAWATDMGSGSIGDFALVANQARIEDDASNVVWLAARDGVP